MTYHRWVAQMHSVSLPMSHRGNLTPKNCFITALSKYGSFISKSYKSFPRRAAVEHFELAVEIIFQGRQAVPMINFQVAVYFLCVYNLVSFTDSGVIRSSGPPQKGASDLVKWVLILGKIRKTGSEL